MTNIIPFKEDEADSRSELDNYQQSNNEIVILNDQLDCNKDDNQGNDETDQNEPLDKSNNANDSTDSPKEIKGFKRDKSNNIICLDCGKRFKQKNSYNYHKRM